MQDSGERRQFETGAVRDRGGHKPRPDLISPHANLREGEWLRKGAEKYAVDNWTKGMPIRECVASLARHLESYKLGLTDEDHMAAIRTNAGFILHYEEEIKAGRLPADLDDMPKYDARPTLGCNDILGHEYDVVQTTEKDGTVRVNFGLNPATPGEDRTALVYVCPSCGVRRGGHPLSVCARCGVDRDAVSATVQDIARPLSQRPFTVYLCGPITGQPVDSLWRDAASAMLAGRGIQTLNPLRGKKPEDIGNVGLSYKGQLAAPEIADRDRLDIEASDVILAHFPYEPPRQSIGSWMEIGAAAIGYKKPVVFCSNVKQHSEHLFCRNFLTVEPDFEQALRRIVAMAQVKAR
jgi:hypothetical protein